MKLIDLIKDYFKLKNVESDLQSELHSYKKQYQNQVLELMDMQQESYRKEKLSKDEKLKSIYTGMYEKANQELTNLFVENEKIHCYYDRAFEALRNAKKNILKGQLISEQDFDYEKFSEEIDQDIERLENEK